MIGIMINGFSTPVQKIANNMYGTNELSSTPTFNDDDWEAIFGTEDEIDDGKKPNQNSEPDAEKPKHNGELDSLVEMVSAKNSAEVSTICSRRIIGSAANSIAPGNNSEVSLLPRKRQDTVHPAKQAQATLSSMVVMDMCMKREQKLRVEGNIVEANALSTVGFSVMNLMAKVMELLQSNEYIHVGSLILEAVKALISKGSDDWESLILCAESIHSLVDEVRIKSAGLDSMEQPKTLNKTEKKLDKKEHATKLAKERKKRKWETAFAKKQQEANEKRKCRAVQQTESQTVLHSPIIHQAENYVETSNRDGNAILMAANKFKNRQEERRRQTKKNSQVNEKLSSLPQSNVSDTNPQVMSNLGDDKRFTGPIKAEALMEECEESDSSNSTTLPLFPVQRNANNQCCLQRSNSFPSSLTGTPAKCHISNHIRNDLPVIREANYPRLINNNPGQAMPLPCLLSPVKISSPSQRSQPDINLTSTANSVKVKFVTSLAQKYDNLNFVKIRKAGAKLNENTVGKLRSKEKNVRFLAESEYSVIEIPSDPNTTAEVLNIMRFPEYLKKYPRGSIIMPEEEERKKQMENLPPREYDFFLGPTTSRPIGSINARSFCESCEFTRGDICNWFIVGSRFDRLNESIFNVKKNGCPKTHLSRANYPPIHFRILSDALTHISINVSGLKIFLAVGEDWIVKKSMMPEEFTSFIRRFAGILYELYVKDYTLEHSKEVEFTEDSGKIKTGYAYVEMPSVILFTIPSVSDSDMEMKCAFYNSAVRELVQNWDTTFRSPYYHSATKQCIELKLIDWRQICINENAISNNSMITVLMKHLMEEWGICMAPVNRP